MTSDVPSYFFTYARPALLYILVPALLYVWRNSLPFSWTVRIFSISLRGRYSASPSFFPLGTSKNEVVTRSEPHLLLSHLPTPGTDLFDDHFTTSEFTATIDECDFNGHLSNSSYPKNFDLARTEFATSRFLRGTLDGAWMALGGTQFRFLHEIAVGSKYRVRMRILGWDDKWCYTRGEFITRNRKTGDEIVNCIATAKLCIKSGRKTIPPWLFFALCGYSYKGSRNPTINWDRAESLRIELLDAARKKSNKTGKVKRDSWLKGRGYSAAAGVLTAYEPVAKSVARQVENGQKEIKERPQWMTEAYWDVAGWEESRLQGLKEVVLSGLASM